jgi:hypothetical protein
MSLRRAASLRARCHVALITERANPTCTMWSRRHWHVQGVKRNFRWDYLSLDKPNTLGYKGDRWTLDPSARYTGFP